MLGTIEQSDVTCYNCRGTGHFVNTCPHKEKNQGWVYTEVTEEEKLCETKYEENEMGYVYHQNLAGL